MTQEVRRSLRGFGHGRCGRACERCQRSILDFGLHKRVGSGAVHGRTARFGSGKNSRA